MYHRPAVYIKTMDYQAEEPTYNHEPERKFVTFYPRVVVKRVPSLKTCPEEDLSRIWFDNYEFVAIRNENKLISERMMNNEPLGPNECSRGLEYRTPEGMKQRIENKKRARCAVLEEQERQWDAGLYDPEALRIISRMVSSASQKASLQVGLNDERFVLSMQARETKAVEGWGTSHPLREIQQKPLSRKLDLGEEGIDGPPLVIVVKSGPETKVRKSRRSNFQNEGQDEISGHPRVAPTVRREVVLNQGPASYNLYSVAA